MRKSRFTEEQIIKVLKEHASRISPARLSVSASMVAGCCNVSELFMDSLS